MFSHNNMKIPYENEKPAAHSRDWRKHDTVCERGARWSWNWTLHRIGNARGLQEVWSSLSWAF